MSGMAEVLVGHYLHQILPVNIDDVNGAWEVECNCGSDPIQGPSYIAAEAAHAAHQAAMLTAAGFGALRPAQEVAWAKGATSAGVNLMALQAGGINPNPYRAAAVRKSA